ncbi:unnamed protein product [Prorocentrum cordatum]|uniref:DUF5672 domain-containing protein n=1 Tax=Prorocentrum cordatum TaxID=2364126 RepID=A0ABN9R5H3_9DINO|nr:unnamed protein product [Polarella glacialis]
MPHARRGAALCLALLLAPGAAERQSCDVGGSDEAALLQHAAAQGSRQHSPTCIGTRPSDRRRRPPCRRAPASRRCSSSRAGSGACSWRWRPPASCATARARSRRGKNTDRIDRRFPRKYGNIWEWGVKTKPQKIWENMGNPVICVYLFVCPRAPSKEPAIQVLTLMHGTGNQEYVTRLVEESEHLREDRRSGRLRLIPLGSTDLGGDLALLEGGLASSRWHSQYSSLFYNMSFWESLKCDHVLTMQSDSLLCLNSKVHLSEFFNYDFVGAVSCGGDSNVSNGGLSLRNRQVMMRCVRRGIQDLKMQEDVFFSEACRDVARAPDLTVRDRFAIEQGFRHANVTPFGLHKPWHQEKSNQYRYVDQNLDMCEGARKLVSMQHE